MKCDICDQEFDNSEEIKAHKERDHPLDGREDDDLEKPDNAPESEPAKPAPNIRPIGQ